MIKRFSIIKGAYMRLGIGAALFVGAVILFFMNMRFSEEFTGGVKLKIAQIQNGETVAQSLQTYLADKKYNQTEVSTQGEINEITAISIKTDVKTDEEVNALSKDLQSFLQDKGYITNAAQIVEQAVVGPSVGDYMQKTAKNAIIIGLIFMCIYMMFSFAAIRKSISPSTLAIVTVITMFFDIAIPAGAYGFMMMVNPTLNIDTVFIIALLTNMGYSINDTIIIFDRIRENIQNKTDKNLVYAKVFDDALWQTMRRSIGTVVATFLVVLSMYIFGTGAIKNFSFTMGMGIIAGSYSSIFISAPLAYLLMGRQKKEKAYLTSKE